MDKIEEIYILGGTHGNEFTGAYIVKNWNNIFQKEPLNSKIKITPLLSNPKAFSNKVRYIDRDLNRSFLSTDLESMNLSGYENERAKSLNNLISNNVNNFIIDTHTTNSSMGISLMTSSKSLFKLNLIKYISDRVENVNIIFTDDNDKDRPFLNSICENSLLIEIGPIANNIIDHDVFKKTINIIKLTIVFLNKIKEKKLKIEGDIKIPVFSIVKEIKYPTDKNGNITAFVHKDIQGKDFIKEIDNSTNIFNMFNGENIKLNEEGKYFMSFINESAYYEENIAFYIMKKTNITAS